MTSSKKKHHPPGAAATPAPAARPVARTVSTVTRKQWIIRIIAGLVIAIGATMTLIGADPDVAGGNGKLLLMVPGMVIVAAGFVAIVETTPYARSKRR
jgi:membrane protein YdbS with pleckstrin-like domain